MSDDPLKPYLDDLSAGYRRPPSEPPYDAMWERIEAAVFDSPAGASPVSRWGRARRWLPFAAMLALGIGIGRMTNLSFEFAPDEALQGQDVTPTTSAVATNDQTNQEPFSGVAADYLEQTTGFFLTLATEVRSGKPLEASVPRARDLLGTTRLLLDNPGTDPNLRGLLEDLELVLAQIIRLPPAERNGPETHFITETLDQRDVLPRLQVFLADTRNLH